MILAQHHGTEISITCQHKNGLLMPRCSMIRDSHIQQCLPSLTITNDIPHFPQLFPHVHRLNSQMEKTLETRWPFARRMMSAGSLRRDDYTSG
jgi:hypothetical protein